MKQVHYGGLKLAILTMSFIQMATNASSVVLAEIAREFPSASVSAVQYLMTFPNLVVVVVSFCMTGIIRIFSKRMIAAAGLGMACLAGILSGFLWSSTYLVYLLAVPGLILTFLFVPGAKETGHMGISRAEKIKIPSFAWKYFGTAAVFMLLFYIGPTNVSLLVTERGMGSAAMAGTASTLLLLGGNAWGRW